MQGKSKKSNSKSMDIYSPYIMPGKSKGKVTRRSCRKGMSSFGVVSLSIIISVIIIVVGVSVLGVAKNGAVVAASKFYCLQFDALSSKADADIKADAVKRMGAAGYIYNDGSFRVIGAIYSSQQELDKVIARISDKTPCTTFVINSPRVSVALGEDSAHKKEVGELLRYPLELYQEIYAISVALDGGEMTESLALLEITNLEKTLSKKLGRLEIIVSEESSAALLQLKAQFVAIKQTMMEIFSTSTDKTSIRIKYMYCKILFQYISTLREF